MRVGLRICNRLSQAQVFPLTESAKRTFLKIYMMPFQEANNWLAKINRWWLKQMKNKNKTNSRKWSGRSRHKYLHSWTKYSKPCLIIKVLQTMVIYCPREYQDSLEYQRSVALQVIKLIRMCQRTTLLTPSRKRTWIRACSERILAYWARQTETSSK